VAIPSLERWFNVAKPLTQCYRAEAAGGGVFASRDAKGDGLWGPFIVLLWYLPSILAAYQLSGMRLWGGGRVEDRRTPVALEIISPNGTMLGELKARTLASK
jgi:hypothetical protein